MSCIVSGSEYTYRKSPMRRVVETLQEKKKVTSRTGLRTLDGLTRVAACKIRGSQDAPRLRVDVN